MAIKLVYKTDTGEIKAIADNPNIDINKLMSNWTDVDWIETDKPITFEMIRYFRVNPITRELEKI